MRPAYESYLISVELFSAEPTIQNTQSCAHNIHRQKKTTHQYQQYEFIGFEIKEDFFCWHWKRSRKKNNIHFYQIFFGIVLINFQFYKHNRPDFRCTQILDKNFYFSFTDFAFCSKQTPCAQTKIFIPKYGMNQFSFVQNLYRLKLLTVYSMNVFWVIFSYLRFSYALHKRKKHKHAHRQTIQNKKDSRNDICDRFRISFIIGCYGFSFSSSTHSLYYFKQSNFIVDFFSRMHSSVLLLFTYLVRGLPHTFVYTHICNVSFTAFLFDNCVQIEPFLNKKSKLFSSESTH